MMFEIDASVLTDAGRVRANNEDSVGLFRPNAADVMKSRGVLALVADGMGGNEGGEFASKLAADGISRGYYHSNGLPPQALAEAFVDVNRQIFEAAAENPALKGMGTTCVAVAICEDQAWWAWVGDSRLYLLRGAEIYRMSEDHTVVHELICRGLLTAEEARDHPDRSILARAMEPGNSLSRRSCRSLSRSLRATVFCFAPMVCTICWRMRRSRSLRWELPWPIVPGRSCVLPWSAVALTTFRSFCWKQNSNR